MTENEFIARIERLEGRLMHQEAALEEMTRTLLAQEKQLREQEKILRRLAELVSAVLPSPLASQAEETPPPHY